MAAIGVARLGDEGQLATAGADLVVTTLDDVSVPALGEGRLQERRAAAEISAGARSGRPASGRWSTTGSTPSTKACARRCARWATGIS